MKDNTVIVIDTGNYVSSYAEKLKGKLQYGNMIHFTLYVRRVTCKLDTRTQELG